MKKSIITIISIVMIMLIFTVNSLGANWAISGYEWAKNNGLVSAKVYPYLSEPVSPDDFYSAFFRFLRVRNIVSDPKSEFWKFEDYSTDNYIFVSMDNQLSQLTSKEWLTVNEYKRAETLIKNARNILEKNPKYFSQSEIKNIQFYLDNMQYILYTKIYDYSFKEHVSVTKTKFSDDFLEYKIIPNYGEISRLEFLNIMYCYTVTFENKSFTSTKAVSYFKERGILQGYNNNLMLNLKLTYAHMSTFMQRMF